MAKKKIQACPICLVGQNSKGDGGNKKCFHCDRCLFVECEYDTAEEVFKNIKIRLKKFYEKERNHSQRLRFGVKVQKYIVKKFSSFNSALKWADWNYKVKLNFRNRKVFEIIKLKSYDI